MSRVTEDALAAADGRSRRWETHRTARRDELTRAVRKAVHHGGADLSMDEIATAIGTSKSIIYRYFTDRSGLQTAVGEAVLTDLGSALAEATRAPGSPAQTVRAMVAIYLEMVSTSPAVYAFVTRTGEAGAAGPMRTLAEDAAALLVPMLEQVLQRTEHPATLAGVWAAGVIGFVRGAADVWLSGPQDQPLPQLTDAITAWICLGIGVD